MAASDTPAEETGGADPFPTARFTALLRRLPRYGRLSFRLGRDDRVPGSRRAALIAAALYLASPIDLVPGIIPVAGQLDDAAAVLLALRLALRGLPPEDRERVLADVGLEQGDLDADLRTIGVVYAWLGRTGARFAWRGALAVGRGVGRISRSVGKRLPGR
ncbi:MAG TPA: DUF1232 domain-containing protein [Candidatus Limnocylindria bacterium]|nr:DUF1232 domain-containing protein [Candidatus Limnocylindria bacterium]